MKKLFILLFVCIWASLSAQDFTLAGKKLSDLRHESVRQELKHWETYDLKFSEIFSAFKASSPHDFTLRIALGDRKLETHLIRQEIFSRDFTLQSGDEIVMSGAPDIFTFQGHVGENKEDKISITIAENTVFACFKQGAEIYFLQQLNNFDKSESKTKVILYEKGSVKLKSGLCMADEIEHRAEELNNSAQSKMDGCEKYNIRLAVAYDCCMVKKYDGAAGVAAHNASVMGCVATVFDNEFSLPVTFQIVKIYTPGCPSPGDPWANTTDPSALLNSFANWANPSGNNGFGVQHHLGQLWTCKQLDCNVAGVAYLCKFCANGPGYHLLSDFTANTTLLCVMTAHEIGHNLCATHKDLFNGQPTIMFPFVNFNLSWHPESVTEINDALATKGACLYQCIAPNITDITIQYASNGLCLADLFAKGNNLSCADKFVWTLKYSIIWSPWCEAGASWVETYVTDIPWLDNKLYDLGCGQVLYYVEVTVEAISDCGDDSYTEGFTVDFTKCIPPSPPGVVTERNALNHSTPEVLSLDMEVMPNPAEDQFRLDWKQNRGEGKIEVLEVSGRVLKTIAFFNGNSQTVDCADLPSGSYLVRLTFKDRTISKGVVIR